jgi:phospholipid/cholesterol/gamma-HCH transport system ATP-binding protein
MPEGFPHYIEFRHVYKTFDKPVLVDSNFFVDVGQTVAIIGRSGVGKSVSLAHIMGFLKPDQGRVIVAHEDITDFLEQREDYDYQNKEQVVDGLLKMVGISEAKDAYPSDLSTGYRRAVAIARAIAAQPQCILYDEPTTMVDPIMSDHLTTLMLRLKKDLRLTSVVVTHDLDLLHNVADKVIFLNKGHIAYFGPTAGLYDSDNPDIQEFLELDKVIRGASLSENDPFRMGLGGVAPEA